MKKVRVLVLAAFAVLVAGCMSTPAAPAKPKGPDLNGEWVVTTTSQMGAQDSNMTVNQTGSDIAGTMSSQRGSVEYTGTVTGNAVAFGFTINAQGTDLRIDYSGTVEGDAMKGKAVFGSFGEGTFTAKKK
jgi:hypothetical protein